MSETPDTTKADQIIGLTRIIDRMETDLGRSITEETQDLLHDLFDE